jgi:predicted flap endonuclease-1-like 5' DNA nuclease
MIDPVKKVFRFFGVLAGIGTVIWVMRDRFISLALPREPEPPTFRVAPHPPQEELSQVDDLTIIKGVGPVYAARLEDAGITSLAGLSAADAEALASDVDVPVGRVGTWIEEATFLSSFQGN